MRAPTSFRGTLRAFAPALALSVAGLTVACADGPTGLTGPAAAPAAAAGAPAFAKAGTTSANTRITPEAWLDGSAPTSLRGDQHGVEAQYAAGDTTVTLLQVGAGAAKGAAYNLSNASKLQFPRGGASICDATVATYGPGTWDQPCQPSAVPLRIVAKTWLNAEGKVATDFQPALRFVPDADHPVVLTLKDPALAGTRVDYCTPSGCVDEAATDPSVAPVLDAPNGKIHRRIKHFSGYTIVANRTTTTVRAY